MDLATGRRIRVPIAKLDPQDAARARAACPRARLGARARGDRRDPRARQLGRAPAPRLQREPRHRRGRARDRGRDGVAACGGPVRACRRLELSPPPAAGCGARGRRTRSCRSSRAASRARPRRTSERPCTLMRTSKSLALVALPGELDAERLPAHRVERMDEREAAGLLVERVRPDAARPEGARHRQASHRAAAPARVDHRLRAGAFRARGRRRARGTSDVPVDAYSTRYSFRPSGESASNDHEPRSVIIRRSERSACREDREPGVALDLVRLRRGRALRPSWASPSSEPSNATRGIPSTPCPRTPVGRSGRRGRTRSRSSARPWSGRRSGAFRRRRRSPCPRARRQARSALACRRGTGDHQHGGERETDECEPNTCGHRTSSLALSVIHRPRHGGSLSPPRRCRRHARSARPRRTNRTPRPE